MSVKTERPYYTYSEVADLLGIKMNTLYCYIWRRKLTPIKRPGFKSVFKKSYIDELLKQDLLWL
jgi:excisionase family DNA binding protein